MNSHEATYSRPKSIWRREFCPRVSIFRFVRWFFSWRILRRCLFGLACLMTLVALFFAIENWRGARAWNQFREESEAKGERFDLASVIPGRVPDDQNLATTPLLAPLLDYDRQTPGRWRDTNALARVMGPQSLTLYPYPRGPAKGEPKPGSLWAARPTDLAVWQEYFRGLTNFPVAPKAQDAASDILLALGKYDAELGELQVASRRPHSVFPVHYDETNQALMPHLAVLKRISMVLQLRATAALAAGKSEAALADIRLMFRLADSVKSEPFPISYLVRLAIIEIALEPVWEGMIQHRWDEQQLQELDQDLKGYDFVPDEVRAIRGDRAFANAFLDRLAADWVARDKLLAQLSPPPGAEPGEDALPFALIAWGPRGWVRQNQVAQAAWFQDVIEDSLSATNLAAKRGQPTSSITEKWNTRLGASTPYNRIARLLVSWSGYLSALWSQTAVNLARTACGLERYRLARGTYPPSLEALVPQYLASVPPDFYSGGPLKYRKTDDGRFVLYSVGQNQTDDGGVPSTNKSGINREQGDWVWRNPGN